MPMEIPMRSDCHPLIVELFVMGGIIYLVGLVVVVLAILSLLGLA